MNPGRFFMPNTMINPTMMRGGLSSGAGSLTRLFRGIKAFDWGKLLTGANKTLNVVNQTIPLIRQAKPMIGNVKNMLKLARAFGNETKNHVQSIKTGEMLANAKSNSSTISLSEDNYPRFFI